MKILLCLHFQAVGSETKNLSRCGHSYNCSEYSPSEGFTVSVTYVSVVHTLRYLTLGQNSIRVKEFQFSPVSGNNGHLSWNGCRSDLRLYKVHCWFHQNVAQHGMAFPAILFGGILPKVASDNYDIYLDTHTHIYIPKAWSL